MMESRVAVSIWSVFFPRLAQFRVDELRRVITPHEAARIQAFPDSFRFVVNGHDPARVAISKWIGDAVPPVLGYAAMLPLLAIATHVQTDRGA